MDMVACYILMIAGWSPLHMYHKYSLCISCVYRHHMSCHRDHNYPKSAMLQDVHVACVTNSCDLQCIDMCVLHSVTYIH